MSSDFNTDLYDEQLEEDRRRLRAKRQRDWQIRKERIAASFLSLVQTLGGCCSVCKTTVQLSIHHLVPRQYDVARLSWSQRVKRYWEEYRGGVPLQALCLKCNGSDGAKRVKRLLGLLRKRS